MHGEGRHDDSKHVRLAALSACTGQSNAAALGDSSNSGESPHILWWYSLSARYGLYEIST